jgi:hypothetical protein
VSALAFVLHVRSLHAWITLVEQKCGGAVPPRSRCGVLSSIARRVRCSEKLLGRSGTSGSNLLPSSGESANPRSLPREIRYST